MESGGKIFNCQSDNWGGAMWFFGKTMDINGGEIFECSAESGGAIYCGAGKVNILGGNITGCYAKKFGNVVYMRTWEEAEVVATLSLIEQKNNRLTIKLDDNAKGEDTDSVNTDGYKGIYIAEGAVCETI